MLNLCSFISFSVSHWRAWNINTDIFLNPYRICFVLEYLLSLFWTMWIVLNTDVLIHPVRCSKGNAVLLLRPLKRLIMLDHPYKSARYRSLVLIVVIAVCAVNARPGSIHLVYYVPLDTIQAPVHISTACVIPFSFGFERWLCWYHYIKNRLFPVV